MSHTDKAGEVEDWCYVCEGTAFRELFSADGPLEDHYHVVRCERCGAVRIIPRPSQEALTLFYDNEGYNAESRTSERWKEWNTRNHFLRKLELIERHAPKGKILDIGCGDGLFLHAAQRRGWDASGVDLGRDNAQYARDIYDLNVFTGTLEEASYPDEHFDVVTIIHLLEHLYDPAALLREVNRVTRRGGYIYVATPNLDYWVYRLLRRVFPGRRGIFYAQEFGGIWPPNHLVVFSRASMGATLKKAGYEVRETVYTNKVIPMWKGRKRWLRQVVFGPVLRLLRSGMHLEMLAQKI